VGEKYKGLNAKRGSAKTGGKEKQGANGEKTLKEAKSNSKRGGRVLSTSKKMRA